MNKVLLSAIAGSFSIMALVSADHPAVPVQQRESDPEPEAPAEEANSCPFNGVYAAIGVGGNSYKHKTEVKRTLTFDAAGNRTSGSVRPDDHGNNMGAVAQLLPGVAGGNDPAAAAAAAAVLNAPALGALPDGRTGHAIAWTSAMQDARLAAALNSTPEGQSVLRMTHEYAVEFDNAQRAFDDARAEGSFIRTDSRSLNHGRFIGTLAIGGGKVFANNFYLGAEVLVDFGSSKAKDGIKISSVSPSLGVRLGYFNRNLETLFYTRVAASHVSISHVSIKAEDSELKVSKFAPAVALGVEKAFTKKLSGRLEGEYRFSSSKKFNFKTPHTDVEAEVKTRGWNIRALAAYHINNVNGL
ncbi:hypothetical protein FACS189449_00370 [Alphaproteobacteria bacterium]|nr:hypothetical protein FACS189449_00370 [Alphaproteobacteria bacterium]